MLNRFATVLARICKRSGWARADHVNDLGCAGALRIDERLLVGAKDDRQPTCALPVMATDAAVVIDGDAVSGVAGAAFRDRSVIRALSPIESLQAMRDIAERLIPRAATSTEMPHAALANERALRVVDFDVTRDPVRTVLHHLDTRLVTHAASPREVRGE
jgi:hypothetical protein